MVVGALTETTFGGVDMCASGLEFVFGVGMIVAIVSVVLPPFNAFMALMYFLWKWVCGVVVDADDVCCRFDDCVETALITLVTLFAMMPLCVETITGLATATLLLLLLLNEDDDDDNDSVFGIMLGFCGKLDTVLYSITVPPPPLGLN